jgi:hypothetical protein
LRPGRESFLTGTVQVVRLFLLAVETADNLFNSLWPKQATPAGARVAMF